MASIIDEHTQWVDSGGRPLNGGSLYIGVVNTDPVANPKDIFSDRSLTTAAANPQTLDSDGRTTVKLWVDGEYSVQVNDINGTQQYQELDNGSAADDITTIGLTGVSGGDTITASGGITAYVDKGLYTLTVVQVNTGAVTLNIDSVGAKSVLKNVTQELDAGDWAANQTVIVQYNETSDNFQWIDQRAVFSGLEAAADPASDDSFFFTDTSDSDTGKTTTFDVLRAPPVYGGYLTPSTGVPVIASDVTSTSVFYTPFEHNLLTIYNGSAFVNQVFSELELELDATEHAADTIYDVFVDNDSATPRIGTGTAWSTSTAGAGDRGTGGSTTELTRINGVLVNANAMTMRNGATTFSLAANLGTYVGSILINNTAGQVTCTTSFGQFRRWGIWNAHNRQQITMKAGDSTASWSYTSTTVRPSNNDSGNNVTVVCGLQEEPILCAFNQHIQYRGNGVVGMGIGFDSTTATSGQQAELLSDGTILETTVPSSYENAPILGASEITCLEFGQAVNSPTFYGTESDMKLNVRYRG